MSFKHRTQSSVRRLAPEVTWSPATNGIALSDLARLPAPNSLSRAVSYILSRSH